MSESAHPALVPGASLDSITLDPISRLQLIKYAGASGDFNPIHTIDEGASAAGLPGIIAHGMLTMATVGRLFSKYLDAGFLRAFEIRFTGMVFVGDVLTVGGRISSAGTDSQGTAFVCDVFARKQDGSIAATGTAEFVLFG
jgi:acyl dehydratase